jgi:serine/threonine protein kinase
MTMTMVMVLQVWKYFLQTAVGLHHIHSRKILHRDIKAMNIFLTKDDNIKVPVEAFIGSSVHADRLTLPLNQSFIYSIHSSNLKSIQTPFSMHGQTSLTHSTCS